MDPITMGAIISGGSQLVGGAINAFSGANLNRRNRQWNEQMYRQTRDDRRMDWHMQNEYNSPQAQRARMEAAGFNPNSLYGSAGTSGNAGTVGGGDVQTPQTRNPEWGNAISGAGLTGINAIYDLEIKQAQADNAKRQGNVIKEQERNIAANTASTLKDVDRKTYDLFMDGQMQDYILEASEQTARQIRTQTDIALDKNEREAFTTASNLKEAYERILSMRESRAKSREERKNLQEARKGIMEDNTLKAIHNALWKDGINPNDPQWSRILGNLLNDYVNGNLQENTLYTGMQKYINKFKKFNPFTRFLPKWK